MKVQTNYKEGDLVRFKSPSNFEQKLGLVVQVIRNRLDQPQGYQVQIGQDVLFFKHVLAQKYFELVENDDDAGRGPCSV